MILHRKENTYAPDSNLSFVSLYLFILIFFVILSRFAKLEFPDSAVQKIVSPLQEHYKDRVLPKYDELKFLDRVEINYTGILFNKDALYPALIETIHSAIAYLKSNRDISHFSVALTNENKGFNAMDVALLLRAIDNKFDAKIDIEYLQMAPQKPIFLKIYLENFIHGE
ncbi:MAG: hypothetical protein SFT68_04795 [Rickettsiaceae bacterium]|nr:hypothetical protein [Rickettsiaceae bacterium]